MSKRDSKAKPQQWKDRFVPNQPTPSMDNKDVPSPPIRTTEEYRADQDAGIQRIGKPVDKSGGA